MNSLSFHSFTGGGDLSHSFFGKSICDTSERNPFPSFSRSSSSAESPNRNVSYLGRRGRTTMRDNFATVTRFSRPTVSRRYSRYLLANGSRAVSFVCLFFPAKNRSRFAKRVKPVKRHSGAERTCVAPNTKI